MKTKEVFDVLKKNSKFILLAVISMVLFHKYLIMIILGILLGTLGVYSLKFSRVIPHISIETITASSILFGYVWGWKIGLIFGVGCGTLGYVKISLIKHTTLTNALFMGFCGVLAAFFKTFGYPFWLAYILTFFIRANLGFAIFRMLNPDLFENIMHSYGDALFNVFITIHLMTLIYLVVSPLV